MVHPLKKKPLFSKYNFGFIGKSKLKGVGFCMAYHWMKVIFNIGKNLDFDTKIYVLNWMKNIKHWHLKLSRELNILSKK